MDKLSTNPGGHALAGWPSPELQPGCLLQHREQEGQSFQDQAGGGEEAIRDPVRGEDTGRTWEAEPT